MCHSTFAALMLTMGVASAVFAADAPSAAPAPAPSVVREVDIKGVKLGAKGGRPGTPTGIKSAEELTTAVPEAEAQAKIKAAVDFSKEQLVLFVWSGSGRDRVTAAEEKADGKTVVVFTFQEGMTRDFRPHQDLFALPADATWKMGGAVRTK